MLKHTITDKRRFNAGLRPAGILSNWLIDIYCLPDWQSCPMADVLRGHVIYGFPPTLYFSVLLHCFFYAAQHLPHPTCISFQNLWGAHFLFLFSWLPSILSLLLPTTSHPSWFSTGRTHLYDAASISYYSYLPRLFCFPTVWGACTQLHVPGGAVDHNTLT